MDMIDLVKRRTRGRKEQNSKENKVEEISNVVENVTNQHKRAPKTRKGKKNDSEENKEEKKETIEKSNSESKEDNASNIKGKRGAHSRRKNVVNKKLEEIGETKIEPLHKSATTSAPRRGRRAAALETKHTEKQTKIDSFLLSQSLHKDAVTSKTNKKNIQSTLSNKDKKTKPLIPDVNKSISGNVTHTTKSIDKSKGKEALSPSISRSNQKLPIWASVANKRTNAPTPGNRKSFRRSVGSGHKDVFEFSFDVGADETNGKKKKKRNTKPRVKKEKPKSKLKSTLLVTDPSWQKPMPHTRSKNATLYTRMKNSVTTSVSKSLSKREALAAKIREKKQAIKTGGTSSQESNVTCGYSSQTSKQFTSQDSSYIKYKNAPKALAAKIQEKKQAIENGGTSSQESYVTSGYSSQTLKQFTSQDSSYIKDKNVPKHDFSGLTGKTPKQVRDISEINFDDDDGCDIHANDFDDCETEEVVERLEFETTSSFRPPQSTLISDSVLPTPNISRSRFFSKFIVGASTPMTDHVKSSNLFRDPEPPKTVVEDMQQCFGFDDEPEHNPLNLSPVRNSFYHSFINSGLEVTGMTVPEEDRQPSRFDFGSVLRPNRSNVSASLVTHSRSIASVSASTSISNSRFRQKNVSKPKITSKKSLAGSIRNYVSTSKKSPSSTKANRISEETFPKEIEMNHPAENVVDNSVLFDEEPLVEEVVRKPLKEVSRNPQNNTKSNKIIPISEVPSPAKSFSKPARKSYDRKSLNESKLRFLKRYSGADASNFGDNEEDEGAKKSKKQKASTKLKKGNNKGEKATLKSENKTASKKVLAKRACKYTRKVNFDSSGDSSLDTTLEEKKLKKKSKKNSKRHQQTISSDEDQSSLDELEFTDDDDQSSLEDEQQFNRNHILKLLKDNDYNLSTKHQSKCKDNDDSDVNQISWYFKDKNQKWIEYGNVDSTGEEKLKSNISSRDIEKAFKQNPKKPLTFTVSGCNYSLDFVKMTQTNTNTNVVREVRRQPLAFSWYFKDKNQKWIEYGNVDSTGEDKLKSSISSRDIEKAFKQNPQKPLTFNVYNFNYSLDFVNMTQTNTDTNVVRKVKRKPKPHLSENEDYENKSTKTTIANLPLTWKPMQTSEHVRMVNLKPSSSEYKTVVNMFKGNYNILKIEKIQNRFHYRAFENKVQQMVAVYNNDSSKADVRQLFHGTNYSVIKSICSENFDWRLHGTSTGNAYGKGTYFSPYVKTSYDYCKADPSSGFKYMFIARVAVGTMTVGDSSMSRPPINSSTSMPYDTTVNNMSNPSIIVKYDKQEYYPQYIVTLK